MYSDVLNLINKKLQDKEASLLKEIAKEKEYKDNMTNNPCIQKILQKRRKARNIITIIGFMLIIFTNILVQHIHVLELENVNQITSVQANKVFDEDISIHDKQVLLKKFNGYMKKQSEVNTVVMSLVFAGTGFIIFSIIGLLERRNYFIDDYNIENKCDIK